MPSSSNYATVLAGPGTSTTDAGRRITKPLSSTTHDDTKSPSNEGMKRVRVTAVMSYNADHTPSTKYEVQEVHSLSAKTSVEHRDNDSRVPAQPSPPLLSERRSPRRFTSVSSQRSLPSDDSPLRTPSPEDVKAYFYPEAEAMWPTTTTITPGAPRIGFPPTPTARQGSAATTAPGGGDTAAGIGLGIGYVDSMYGAQGSIVHEYEPEERAFDSFVFHPDLYTIESRYTGVGGSHRVGLGISLDGHVLWGDSGGGNVSDDSPAESDDDGEAYYHLPSGLLSPELTMSTEEFKSSVRKWMERRSGNSRADRQDSGDENEMEEHGPDAELK